MFDPAKEVWSEKAIPLHTHHEGIFAASAEKLFLSGGHSGVYTPDERGNLKCFYQETAELYDIKSDQWSNILDIHPNLHPSLCRIRVKTRNATDKSGNIYLVGSTDADDLQGSRDVAMVINPLSGVVSKYEDWDMSSRCFVIVPKGRF